MKLWTGDSGPEKGDRVMKKTAYNWTAHHARRVTEMNAEARAKVMTNADKLALFEKSLREYVKNV